MLATCSGKKYGDNISILRIANLSIKVLSFLRTPGLLVASVQQPPFTPLYHKRREKPYYIGVLRNFARFFVYQADANQKTNSYRINLRGLLMSSLTKDFTYQLVYEHVSCITCKIHLYNLSFCTFISNVFASADELSFISAHSFSSAMIDLIASYKLSWLPAS